MFSITFWTFARGRIGSPFPISNFILLIFIKLIFGLWQGNDATIIVSTFFWLSLTIFHFFLIFITLIFLHFCKGTMLSIVFCSTIFRRRRCLWCRGGSSCGWMLIQFCCFSKNTTTWTPPQLKQQQQVLVLQL